MHTDKYQLIPLPVIFEERVYKRNELLPGAHFLFVSRNDL